MVQIDSRTNLNRQTANMGKCKKSTQSLQQNHETKQRATEVLEPEIRSDKKYEKIVRGEPGKNVDMDSDGIQQDPSFLINDHLAHGLAYCLGLGAEISTRNGCQLDGIAHAFSSTGQVILSNVLTTNGDCLPLVCLEKKNIVDIVFRNVQLGKDKCSSINALMMNGCATAATDSDTSTAVDLGALARRPAKETENAIDKRPCLSLSPSSTISSASLDTGESMTGSDKDDENDNVVDTEKLTLLGTCSSVSSISTDGDKFVQRKPRNIVEETFQHVVDDVDHKERDGRRIERNPRTVKSENGVFLHGHSRTAPAYLNGNEKAMNGNSSRRYVEPVRFTSKSLLTETRSKATKNVACEKDKQGRTFTAGSERNRQFAPSTNSRRPNSSIIPADGVFRRPRNTGMSFVCRDPPEFVTVNDGQKWKQMACSQPAPRQQVSLISEIAQSDAVQLPGPSFTAVESGAIKPDSNDGKNQNFDNRQSTIKVNLSQNEVLSSSLKPKNEEKDSESVPPEKTSEILQKPDGNPWNSDTVWHRRARVVPSSVGMASAQSLHRNQVEPNDKRPKELNLLHSNASVHSQRSEFKNWHDEPNYRFHLNPDAQVFVPKTIRVEHFSSSDPPQEPDYSQFAVTGEDPSSSPPFQDFDQMAGFLENMLPSPPNFVSPQLFHPFGMDDANMGWPQPAVPFPFAHAQNSNPCLAMPVSSPLIVQAFVPTGDGQGFYVPVTIMMPPSFEDYHNYSIGAQQLQGELLNMTINQGQLPIPTQSSDNPDLSQSLSPTSSTTSEHVSSSVVFIGTGHSQSQSPENVDEESSTTESVQHTLSTVSAPAQPTTSLFFPAPLKESQKSLLEEKLDGEKDRNAKNCGDEKEKVQLGFSALD